MPQIRKTLEVFIIDIRFLSSSLVLKACDGSVKGCKETGAELNHNLNGKNRGTLF